MLVLVVLTQKGGSGKTTLAGHIAVQAELSGAGPVAVLDADPQESLAEWADERTADNPVVAQTSLWQLDGDVRRMRDLGMKLLVIDTPPGITPIIKSAIAVSDLVLIPVKPSPHDLRAAGKTVGVVGGMGKPLVFVVNCASPWARITSDAVIALSQHGVVAPVIVHQRADFASSMIDGRTVMEIARKSPSADEIALLWVYLNARLTPFEQLAFDPVTEPFEDRVPLPEHLRKVAPGGAGARDPQHRLQKQPPVAAGPARIGLLSQAVRLHLLPLRIRQHHSGH